MARQAAVRPKRQAGGAGVSLWLLGLGCGALVALATPVALLVGGLLAPALLALLVDPRHGARPLLLLGLATLVRPLVELCQTSPWQTGATNDAALAAVADNAATAWIIQAGG